MILAIAILAGAFVVLGELVRIGTRAGGGARDLTEAQLICESIMSEIIAGGVQPDPVTRAVVPADSNWLYSIWLQSTDEEDLVVLRVTVEQNLPDKKNPLGYTLIRWIPDPGIELPEEDPQQEAEADESEDGASESSSSNAQDGDNSSGTPELPSGLGNLPASNLPVDNLPSGRGSSGGRTRGR